MIIFLSTGSNGGSVKGPEMKNENVRSAQMNADRNSQ